MESKKLSLTNISEEIDSGFVPVSNPKTIPAFLHKLYNMVSESSSNNLIKWSEDGSSFIVTKPEDFAKDLLPRFFKHNNFSSFVRQLNMYGFHKVPRVQQSNNNDMEYWEFSNENFKCNHPELLIHVKRKSGKDHDDRENLFDYRILMDELAAIRKQQAQIASELHHIQADNQLLWSESLASRERNLRQQELIDKIMKFLASFFTNENRQSVVLPKKRRFMIEQPQNVADEIKDVLMSPILSVEETPLDNVNPTIDGTSKSIDKLSKDIDNLQSNIESLTESLGLDNAAFDENGMNFFLENYSGSSKNDEFDISNYLADE